MTSLTVQAPAKLNFYLKVLNKRPDGFHNIKTLFERINLCDEIRLKRNKKGVIRIFCHHPQVPKGPKNLVYKMAKLIQRDMGIDRGVDIFIKKQIPVAARLAGGSSNAAAVLLGLNRLWNLTLSHRKMIDLACQIGSDVAFFLYDCSWALGTQRGDKIKIIKMDTKLWHILVVPCMKIYTSQVYGGHKLQLTKTTDNVNILIHYLKNNNLYDVGQYMSNDLEKEIFRLKPNLLKIKKSLKLLIHKGVMVSGSGPSIYGLTDSEQEASRIKSVLSKRFKQVFVVRTQ